MAQVLSDQVVQRPIPSPLNLSELQKNPQPPEPAPENEKLDFVDLFEGQEDIYEDGSRLMSMIFTLVGIAVVLGVTYLLLNSSLMK